MKMQADIKMVKVYKTDVNDREKAQYRPCKLHPEPLKDIDEWMQQYRRFFEESFDRLDDYLKQIQTQKGE